MSVSSFLISRWRINRLVAVQRCPVVPKAPHRAPSSGKTQIRIFHDDLRVFAAQFQGDPFELLAAHRGNLPPHRSGTGKRNQLHVGMAHQRRADFLATAVNQIDDARGHARLPPRSHNSLTAV